MKIIRSTFIMQSIALKLRSKGRSTGLVPTMGALHGGHISLIEKARAENDIVIVSIFVNPAQFGPGEDYLRYPRPFKKDTQVCRKSKVDFVFAPSVSEMYPEGYKTFVNVENVSEFFAGNQGQGISEAWQRL